MHRRELLALVGGRRAGTAWAIPIAEVAPDGTFVVTKHDGTGGLVTVDTVGRAARLRDGRPGALPHARTASPISRRSGSSRTGRDRVRVSGITRRRRRPTRTRSRSPISRGTRPSGQLTMSGPDAVAKARICADAIWGRLARAGRRLRADAHRARRRRCLSRAAHARAATPGRDRPARRRARTASREKVDRFGKELAPLVTSGPPGVTGFAGGRPKATEVLGYWPALIPKRPASRPQVVVEEVA